MLNLALALVLESTAVIKREYPEQYSEDFRRLASSSCIFQQMLRTLKTYHLWLTEP